MCVYVCACVCVFVHVCMFVCVYMCVCLCVYLWLKKYKNVVMALMESAINIKSINALTDSNTTTTGTCLVKIEVTGSG